MRRVIQRTVTTTKIISLTITHSESEEAVEYTLVDGAEQLDEPIAPVVELAADDHTINAELPATAADSIAAESATYEPDSSGAARPQTDVQG